MRRKVSEFADNKLPDLSRHIFWIKPATCSNPNLHPNFAFQGMRVEIALADYEDMLPTIYSGSCFYMECLKCAQKYLSWTTAERPGFLIV